jgi:putative drug exporter of the RND superfamily
VLARLAHVVARHRWKVIGAWVVLTLFGGFAAGQVHKRWYQSFSIPGKSAYEANQRTLKAFGTGIRPPDVVVFHTAGDATKSSAIEAAMGRAAKAVPGARTSSYFATHSLIYVSADKHTTFEEIYPPGQATFSTTSGAADTLAAAQKGLPSGIQVNVTGHDPLEEASSHGSGGGNVLVEAVIGGLGAIVILLFVFGTLPAMLMPIAVAIAAILNTFTLVWALTYVTNVSIIVQFLIALVGLGVAIDYALLMIFRFRDELREGKDVETALVETMTHAGRSVIVSGSTVAVGLLSMIILPLPFIRSIGIGGMLIPAVSVLAAITFMPALLAVLGERINNLRVLPKRFVDRGHPEDGAWGNWARFVLRRPWAVATTGLVIVGVLIAIGVQLNPNESQLKNFPGTGTAIAGRQMLADAGISPGVMKPFVTLVENGLDANAVAATERTVPGIVGATVPPGPGWHQGQDTLVEAFPAIDGAAPGIQQIIDRTNSVLQGPATLGGVPAVDRDFIHAVYGNFVYVLAFVLILTLVLLTRAFRSIVLPIKAAILNLVSLGGAFGIVVFIFQMGHGSSLWNITATHAITAWIPLMIFAFLFGLSMDYEVFMLTRMREAYDETRSTDKAIELGLARTGKLVTSAALILMFAFLVLSSSPGFEIKEFAIGLAAGIIFDATVIRALLVPALMKLLGEANWYLPQWTRRVLFIAGERPEGTPALDS